MRQVECLLLPRRQQGELQGVEAVLEFLGQQAIDQPVAGHPSLAGKSGRDHLDVEMGFAAGRGTGMARVAGGVVGHLDRRRRQRPLEFFADSIGHAHGVSHS